MSLSDVIRNIAKTVTNKDELKEKAKDLPLFVIQTTLSAAGQALLLVDRVKNSIKGIAGREETEEQTRPAAEQLTADKAAEEDRPARREPVIFAPRPSASGTAEPNGAAPKAKAEPVIFTPSPKAEPAAKPETAAKPKPPAAAEPKVAAEPKAGAAAAAKPEAVIAEPVVEEAKPVAEPVEPVAETAAKPAAKATSKPAATKPKAAATKAPARRAAAKPAAKPAAKATPSKPAAKPAAKTAASKPAAEAAPAKPAPVKDAAGAVPAEPLEGYGELTVASLRARMRGKSAEQLKDFLAYEQATQARPEVVKMYENRLAKLEAGE